MWKWEEQRNVEYRRTTYFGKGKKQVIWNMEEQRNVQHRRT